MALVEAAARAAADDDFRLVAAVARGDRPALERLYTRHAPALLGVALAMLRRGRAEAEDLLHDVFVEIWQHAGDYDPRRGSVRAWMTLRMRSRALDRIKSPTRARTSSLSDEAELERARGDTDPSASPEQAPDRAPDHAKVRRVLAALPSEQREVLRLQYFEGLSGSEAAERLAVPIGTVKSRTAAALRKLAVVLNRSPDGATESTADVLSLPGKAEQGA